MHRVKMMKLREVWLALALAGLFALAACGDGEGVFVSLPDEEENGENDNGDESEPAEGDYRIGTGSGEDFEEGVLEIDPDTISPGASAMVLATVVDGEDDYEPVGEDFEVQFNSDCVETEQASIDAEASTNEDGVAEATYEDDGCEDSDEITASIQVDTGGDVTETREATGIITIDEGDGSSLVFRSALPQTEQSYKLWFQLNDSQGQPIPGQQIDFSGAGEGAGLRLSRDSGMTDSDGLIGVAVYPVEGHDAESVRIKAHAAGLTSSSYSLPIETGDSDSR